MPVELATTSEQREDVFSVRRRVFVNEQDISETLEWDEHDNPAAPTAHFIAYSGSQPVGTARLRVLNESVPDDADNNVASDSGSDIDAKISTDTDTHTDTHTNTNTCSGNTKQSNCNLETAVTETTTIGKVERVAVLADHRNQGWGARLMQTVETHARQCGLSILRLHGQTRVESFYNACGYSTVSDVFEEAGIPHVSMEKRL
jgi:predicted GNAT family N-acyltransferase